MTKVAIIVHATENEMGRALHALLYAQELHEAKIEVKVYFDGQGTVWVKTMEDPSHMFNPLYKAVKATGILAGACGSCADAFGVTQDIQAAGINTLAEAEGHFSVAKLVADGYQIITL
ncbi:DsrE family protein [Paenibacillus aestuarii]|uniref:DsrE family protein n=1 Tax=Paenibacillus aestuarii TaxID=516965 RepID=A0ABW0KGJ3_9BACL|nr:DsrE family protein [Paenibacillus aestuarii]